MIRGIYGPPGSRFIGPSLLLLTFLLLHLRLRAQEKLPLSISDAYRLARQHYPLIRQRDLISKSKDYSVANAKKGFLPMISINGQATYQSTVTTFPFSVPIPGFSVPHYNKDQYKAYAEADQLLYDGGQIKNQQQTLEATENIQQQQLEVALYAIYERVNELFFGILLLNEELKQNTLLQNDIQNGIDKTQALVSNGLAYRSSVSELTAQLLQAKQARTEMVSARRGYLNMLSLFIGRPLDEQSVLELPPALSAASDSINRPELHTFAYQKKLYDLQDNLLGVQLRPKLGLFVQGGYGRPGLNPLSNDFAWYYIGGLKLSWNLGSLYVLKDQRRLHQLARQDLDIQKETFLLNTQLAQQQQGENIVKFREATLTDTEIVGLRHTVKSAAQAQLENGVISPHDFITQIIAEDQARQNLILHQVQLLQAQYTYQNTIGNINIQQP